MLHLDENFTQACHDWHLGPQKMAGKCLRGRLVLFHHMPKLRLINQKASKRSSWWQTHSKGGGSSHKVCNELQEGCGFLNYIKIQKAKGQIHKVYVLQGTAMCKIIYGSEGENCWRLEEYFWEVSLCACPALVLISSHSLLAASGDRAPG